MSLHVRGGKPSTESREARPQEFWRSLDDHPIVAGSIVHGLRKDGLSVSIDVSLGTPADTTKRHAAASVAEITGRITTTL